MSSVRPSAAMLEELSSQVASLARVADRLYAFAALRATAIFLALLGHAGVAYMSIGVPNLLWAVRDRSTNIFFDGMCLWMQGFTMPLFFVMSGYFTVGLYQARGPRGYVMQRVTRVLGPFVIGAIVVLPITLYVWAYGWLISGRCTLDDIRRLDFSPAIQRDLWGPAHLWFLEYLFLFSLILFAYRLVRAASGRAPAESDRSRPAHWQAVAMLSPLRPVLWAVPTALVLWASPDTLINFHNTFIPIPLKFLHYLVFFIAGTWLYQFRWGSHRFLPFSSLYIALSVPAFVCMGLLLKQRLAEPPLSGFATLVLVVSMALFAWFSVFGYLGLFLRFFKSHLAVVRYLSDASIWVYLIHFPIVGLAQILLSRLPGPAAAKFLVVAATALGLSVLTYQFMVRYTLLGIWLHGPRERPAVRAAREQLEPA